MKKFLKRLLCFAVCLALAVGLVRFGPYLYERFFGTGNTKWISQKLSETLREKNELLVYEAEITGQETVSQEAWLIGTVQKVEIPYTFQINFSVDLSLAKVEAVGSVVEVRVPAPVPGYHKLIVDEAGVRKQDWLYRLTPERYAAIKQELEQRLFDEYSVNETYRQNAWNTTVHNLQGLFQSIAAQSAMGETCRIRVIQQTMPPDKTTV